MTDKANDLYEKAIELSKRFDERFLDLASTLRQLRDVDPHLFRLCVENSHISLRKAYYLLEVAETFEKLHVPEKRLMAIGWTKLQVIAGHVTKQNVGTLLKLAETENTRDLKAMMKGETAKTRPHCVLMYFTEDQYAEFVDAVLEFGGAKSGRGLVGKGGGPHKQIQTHKKLLAWCIERFEAEAKGDDDQG